MPRVKVGGRKLSAPAASAQRDPSRKSKSPTKRYELHKGRTAAPGSQGLAAGALFQDALCHVLFVPV